MSEVLQTQEVGSLAKPNWRVAVVNDRPLTEQLTDQALHENWYLERPDDPDYLTFIGDAEREYTAHQAYAPSTKQAFRDFAARLAVRLQEKAGLDIVYDGEQDRSEMYEHAVRRTNGFESRGRLRVFDNRTFHKFAATGVPSIDEPWHSSEVDRLAPLTDRQIKVPITGPYTIADWSFDEYFEGDREAFVQSVTDGAVRPNIEALLAQGVEWVQIDEPAAGTRESEIPLFVESFNRTTEGLVGRFSIHLCFSKWQDFIPYIGALKNCHQLSIEFANRDAKNLGTSAKDRPAYEILRDIHRELPKVTIGLGVVSVHEDEIESPELVRDRILRAVDIVGDPALIYPSPDCGLRTLSWSVAYDKLRTVAEGTKLAKQTLGVE